MTNRTIGAVAVLLIILGLIWWWQEKRTEPEQQAINSVSVFNQTKNAEANQVSPNDTLILSFNVENPNKQALEGFVVEANISDVQKSASLVDAEGANYNPTTGSLIWTPFDIPAKGAITKKVTVEVKHDLPDDSDLTMRVKFGNEITMAVAEPQVAGETQQNDATAQRSAYVSPKSGLPMSLSSLLALSMTLGVSLYKFRRKI
ncbi:MAG: hypothetical protein HYV13_01320 [Candidatus Doudnabacteria bacterium]|nr:hypothetical protein [Candidatus Doudnabacteria bacterium]